MGMGYCFIVILGKMRCTESQIDFCVGMIANLLFHGFCVACNLYCEGIIE